VAGWRPGQVAPGHPGQVLLGLLAVSPDPCRAELSAAQWDMIDGIAEQHRLQPLLHSRNRDGAHVPPAILARWADARRAWAAVALVQRAELQRTVRLLEDAGLHPVALKGAWLAWHVYPEPGLRPLRDLDLLLPAHEAIAAHDLLGAHGYRSEEARELSLADSLALDKHLPPLLSPRGVTIELHHRLWEIDGRMDHMAPEADEQAFLRRCERTGGVLFPCPQDMLVHLIVHAAYDHRLDCGGLVLSDIAGLLRRHAIDWPEFWRDADRRGYRRGAQTLLAMVATHHDPEARVQWDGGRPQIPPDILTAAARLLFQDLATRRSAGVYATARAAGWQRFWRRIRARRGATAAAGTTGRDLAASGGYLSWAIGRLRRTVRQFARPAVMIQGRDLATMSRWLDGQA